jgi:hypothetical protein
MSFGGKYVPYKNRNDKKGERGKNLSENERKEEEIEA